MPLPSPTDLPALDVPPGPRLAEPLPADRPVRWGILATGNIADAFVTDLALLEECEVVAAGARRQESADAFTARHGIDRAYGDYRSLVEDPEVDVVYVASPHGLHREHAELALRAGKAVLCEKAFTINAAEADQLVTLARERGLFLMEAMWMRCNPLLRRLQQLVAAGELGQVRAAHADLGFHADVPSTDRLLDPALGGGATLDLGVYVLTLAQLFLGEPREVRATAVLSELGADLNLALALSYADGGVASLTASLTSWVPGGAWIATDRGRLEIPDPFYSPDEATWVEVAADPDDEPERQRVGVDRLGQGYTHEALEVVRCLRNGETESPLVPLDDTVAMMRLMDRVREQIGLRYDADLPAGSE